jgi:hypothetical protein
MTDLNLTIALIVIGSAAVAAELRADDRQRSPAARKGTLHEAEKPWDEGSPIANEDQLKNIALVELDDGGCRPRKSSQTFSTLTGRRPPSEANPTAPAGCGAVE